MADKMLNEIDENILKTKNRTVEKLISDIEEIIKDKLGNKNFSNNYPFVKVNGKINYDLPETLKKFGEKEERNWIFYGPPGTGKTFALNKISSSKLEYVINPEDCNAAFPIVKFVKDHFVEKFGNEETRQKVLALCIYLFLAKPFNKNGVEIIFNDYIDRTPRPPGSPDSGNVRTFFIRNESSLLPYFKFAHAKYKEISGYPKNMYEENVSEDHGAYYPSFFDDDCLNEFEKLEAIKDDFVSDILKTDILAVCNSIIDDLLSHVTKIVFHPSYTYEDFVGGIKPDLVQTKSKDPSVPLTYKYTPGVMLDLIRKAWGNKGERYYLIIDEFNRGNIAAIFGEFLYLIENDKRSKDKNSGVDYVFLPGGVYPWDDKEKVEPFSEECKIRMPENIFIVGALNTADRSIATMDFAMRRRFNFVKFEPNEELIKGFNWENTDTDTDVTGNVQRLFISLNRSIKYKLDADHEIGHYYFMHADGVKKDTEAFLKDLFERKIIPLLEAYCDHDEQAVKIILVLTNILMKARENGTPPALISLDNLKKLTAKQIKSDYWNGLKDSAEKNISGLYEALIKLVNSNSGTVSTEGETNDGNK